MFLAFGTYAAAGHVTCYVLLCLFLPGAAVLSMEFSRDVKYCGKPQRIPESVKETF